MEKTKIVQRAVAAIPVGNPFQQNNLGVNHVPHSTIHRALQLMECVQPTGQKGRAHLYQGVFDGGNDPSGCKPCHYTRPNTLLASSATLTGPNHFHQPSVQLCKSL